MKEMFKSCGEEACLRTHTLRTVVLGMLAHGDAVHPNVQLIRRMYLSSRW